MAKQERKPGMSAKSRGRRAPRRLQRREIVGWAVASSLLIAALLTLDVLPASAVGLAGRIPIAGEISGRDYKAPSDVEIVDEAATQKLRAEAAENAPVVYDFDSRRRTVLAERLAGAFSAARAARVGAEPAADPAATPAAAFRAKLGTEAPVDERALAYLAELEFSPDAERHLFRMVEPVVGRMIVDDLERFGLHVEKAVVVRELGSEQERTLASASEVLSTEQARGALGDAVKELVAVPEAARSALLPLAHSLVRPNLQLNLRATDERRQLAERSVKEAVIRLRKGEIIVRDGERVTARHVLLLRGVAQQERALSRTTIFLGVAGLICLSLSVLWRFGTQSLPRFPREPKDARFLLATLVANTMGIGIAVFLADSVAQNPSLAPLIESSPTLLYFAIPVAASTMLVRMVHNAETAALFAVVSALLAGLQVQGNLPYAFFTLVGSLTAAVGAARVNQRGTLLRAGVRVGAINGLAILAIALVQGQYAPVPVLLGMLLGLFGGAISGVLVSGCAPVVEGLFGYTTDVKLLELANREQKLLRELELRAPGTYHHSMMVGHLAEKAAEAIGANALLAKVDGYYHDIGKMRRPQFFVENITVHGGENRHEKLAPSMSARIIQAHVKDGLELAEKHNLAEPIRVGIGQHHGTSIIRFFYEKAKEIADPEKGELVHEHDYRYPGPKPQTREAGILMLADSVEAASRTLADNTPSRVQQLVSRIINNYFRDGQLDECSLTLRDLNKIAKSFIDTLTAIRHERIDYPDPTDAKGERLGDHADESVPERQQPRKKDRPDPAPERRDDDLKRLGLD